MGDERLLVLATSSGSVAGEKRGERRIEDIEVLRAVAVLMTMIGHAPELLPWPTGPMLWSATSLWGGVDLFFCISGFVISRSLINSVTPRSGLANFFRLAIPFWIRRLFRIWPAALFWLAMTVLASLVFQSSGAFGPVDATLRDALSAVLQVANLHYLDCLTFKSGTCFNLTGIYWSLSLEEQFYILFPFLIFALSTRQIAWLFAFCILAQFFLWRPPWSIAWAVRSDTLMFGVLIAIAQTKPSIALIEPLFLRRRLVSITFFVVIVGLIAIVPHNMWSVTGLDVDKPFVWFNTGILALLCAGLVFTASFDKGYVLPSGRTKQLLVYVGSRSFSLYLCHNLVYFLVLYGFSHRTPVDSLGPKSVIWMVVIGASASLVFAEGTFRYIETPLRLVGRKKAVDWRAASLGFKSEDGAKTGSPPVEDPSVTPPLSK